MTSVFFILNTDLSMRAIIILYYNDDNYIQKTKEVNIQQHKYVVMFLQQAEVRPVLADIRKITENKKMCKFCL